MSTKSESILTALQSTLTTAGITHVYRSRQTAFAREDGVATAIEPVRDDPNYIVSLSGPEMGMLTVHVVTIARGVVPDQVAAPRLAAIEAALHADRSLGGACSMLWLKSTDWDFDDADLGAVVVTQRWDLQYLF